MATSVWLRDDQAVRRRYSTDAHEEAAKRFIDDLLCDDFWKYKRVPDFVEVIARVGRGSLHVVRVDIVDLPARGAYVGGLARRCNRAGEEV